MQSDFLLPPLYTDKYQDFVFQPNTGRTVGIRVLSTEDNRAEQCPQGKSLHTREPSAIHCPARGFFPKCQLPECQLPKSQLPKYQLPKMSTPNVAIF